MFVVRLVVLLLLTAFCLAMGTIPNGNAIAQVFGPLFFVVAPVLYFLPTIEAALRQHTNLLALGALNLLLGWTVIGWVGAMVWALARPGRVVTQEAAIPVPEPSWMSRPGKGPGVLPVVPAPAAERTCPYCAETVKAAAIVCKHCGRDLEPIK